MNALFSKLMTMAATIPGEETASAVNFKAWNFVENLKYMAAGMIGIFIVIGAIILTIVVLGKLTAPRRKDNEK